MATLFFIKKIVQKLVILYIVLTLVFIIPRLAPGSPIDYLVENPRVPPEMREILLKKFGLDKPIFPDQYFKFLERTILNLDFGYSFLYQEPVFKLILERLVWTIILMGTALVLSSVVGSMLGVVTAWKRGRIFDYSVTLSTLFLRSLPVFWVGMILLLYLSYYYNIFPTGGATTPGLKYASFLDYVRDVVMHITLPLLAIIPIYTARYLMVMRNTMVEILGEDFIFVAKVKGLSDKTIMFKHAARNALLPLITMLAIDTGFIMGGAIVTETVFSYPGVGSLIYEAVLNHDYPLILGAFFIISAVTLSTMMIAEILYAILDPRVRVSEA